MIDKKNIPAHIAIIMDGNGRWARKRGLPRIEGHRRGLKTIKEVMEAALDLGVKFLSLYAFSTENWKRPRQEVDFLMAVCESFINEELPMLKKKEVRFRHIGRLQELSGSLRDCISRAESQTRDNARLCVQLAFNYGARCEIIDAVKKIAEEVKAGRLAASQITEELFSGHLYTQGAPDPDLLIRTSGEQRVSNFLLWQICYAEFFVTKKCWPDFNRRDLARAIEDYQRRKRRFGGVDD